MFDNKVGGGWLITLLALSIIEFEEDAILCNKEKEKRKEEKTREKKKKKKSNNI